MRPPMMKRAVTTVEAAQSDSPPTDSRREGYLEKVKLAQHLHDQGVNPLRWTEAHPAPQTAQQRFQETGRKTRDNQFDVDGRLYDWSPAVSASPAQAKALTEAYAATTHQPLAGPGAPVEALIDVDKVPLRHPLGTPHARRVGASRPGLSVDEERAALYRHYAKSGVDPDKAHLGDPLPMAEQEKLKAEIARLLPGDKTEISGLPMFYQGFDDGWIYMPNTSTQEGPEVQKIRLAHAEKQAQSRDDRAPVAVNDNDAALDDRIVEHYAARDQSVAASGGGTSENADTRSTQNIQQSKQPSAQERDTLARQQLDEMSHWMPVLVMAVAKVQNGRSVTAAEQTLFKEIGDRFAAVGVWFDPNKVNLEFLRETAKTVEHARTNDGSRAPLHVLALATNAGIAQALVNGSMDWAKLAQVGWPEGLRQSAKLLKGDRIRSLLGATITAANAADVILDPRDQGLPDLLSIPDEWAQAAIEGVSSMFGNEDADLRSPPNTITSTEQGQRQKELTPATPQTLKALQSGLADASTVQIWIGGEPLFKQGEHKTLMDNIFREEFIKVAQEKGCLPNPNDPEDKRTVREYGGDQSQKRITDTDQPGHLGSRQPDGTVEWTNFDGTATETHWGSTTPRADGFTETAREWRALRDTVVKIDKHLAMGAENMEELLELTKNPVKGSGPIYYMSEKRSWYADDLRNFIRKKLRERFDKDFRDCKFIGESRLVKLDDPNDPDLPQKP